MTTRDYNKEALEEALEEKIDALGRLQNKVDTLDMQLQAVYADRDLILALLVRMCAGGAGWSVGVGPASDAEPGFSNVIYIKTPEGQLSWHFPDSEADLFDGLPDFGTEWVWDGHTTEQKHDRMRRVIRIIDKINIEMLGVKARQAEKIGS